MEWNEIEDKWRDKQKNIKTEPSVQAWKLLSEKLDNHQPKERGKIKYLQWLSIAACLVLGGFAFQFINSDSLEDKVINIEEEIRQSTPSVVHQEEEIVKEQNDTREDVNVKKDTKVVSEEISRLAIVDIDEQRKGEGQELISVEDSKVVEKESTGVGEIPSLKGVRTAMIKVDSDLLLNQVEGELEMEYRESRVERVLKETKKIFVNKMK